MKKNNVFKVVIVFCVVFAVILGSCGDEDNNDNNNGNNNNGNNGNGGINAEIEMISVPGGSFQMGNPDSSVGENDECPVHTVTLSAFSIGKYEVTQAQYQAVMGSNPASGYGVGGNYPVYKVRWYDALVFCNKLSITKGLTPAYRINNSTDPAVWGTVTTRSNTTWDAVEVVSGSNGYRLPTEAQWEYAAKGGNGSPGNYTYAGSNNIDDVAWYGNTWYFNSGSAHPVGTKAPNGLGLYDMSGNVEEWCWDWDGYYSSEAQTDPTGASAGTGRVSRGGNWSSATTYARSVCRSYYYPGDRGYNVGFRLVRP
ncbi:MAG: formylglycine-generating enzyme family protein [Treponema sp.]|jgi:formylglycine-generating enzyme required for sulfatase activity|nr:formylglycine-generating enzyme family protein [Treponema sp.]